MPISILDQMRSGEIYAPEQNGKPAEYIIERQQYAGGQDISPVMRDTGYQDAMNARNVEPETQRLMNIQQQTGAQMTGLENKLGFDPERAAKFESLSDTDKMAAQMVASGQMSPKDFYATAKKAETDKHVAALKFLSQVDPNRNPVDMMQGGKSVGVSGKSIESFLAGDTQINIGKPYPTMVYNIGTGGKTNTAADARASQAALRATEFSEKEKDRISALEEGKSALASLVDMYNKHANGGGLQNAPGRAAAGVPLVGQYLAPDQAMYNNLVDVVSEKFLRVATGAAAPKDEKVTYKGFQPQLTDKPDQAQSKLNTFFNNIVAKTKASVAPMRLEAQALRKAGQTELADAKDYRAQSVEDLITSALASMPQISGGQGKGINPQMQNAASFATIDEANAAGARGEIPPGTTIIVGGRPAVWE